MKNILPDLAALCICIQTYVLGFPGSSAAKNLPAMEETQVRFLGQEDPLQKEIGNSLQYSCLENPIDRPAWQATSPWDRKSRT